MRRNQGELSRDIRRLQGNSTDQRTKNETHGGAGNHNGGKTRKGSKRKKENTSIQRTWVGAGDK